MKTMALSREITLTIDDYNITLDKEIKIYEYDAINLCFTIQECGIVMRDGKAHNRIMPIVALRAYMLIETPQGTDSVEATNIVRNKIMFSLGNKYSGFVGTGKMQIILKDFDGCRITLPEFAYEVKQSINTGWDDGSFDVLITEKGDTIITDELGRPVETTKISEMDEVNEITPQTYTMVINEDGNKKIDFGTIIESINETIESNVEDIDERIDRIIEVYDDEEIEVEFPSLHNDVERIKGEINEISESLDNIENEKATKQEVNELDVKIAENKSLTDSEISRLKEIANTWETFKSNGGEIGGQIILPYGISLSGRASEDVPRDMIHIQRGGMITVGDQNNGLILTSKSRPQIWEESTPKLIVVNDDFPISKEPNGYTKLPNGLIIQWGHLHLANNLGSGVIRVTVSFPIQFPKDVLRVYLTPTVDSYHVDDEYSASWERPPVTCQITSSNFEFAFQRLQGRYGAGIDWFAIGY